MYYREVMRVGREVTTTVGVCGSPGYVDGQRNASRLERPTACLVDWHLLLIADDGNKVIRSYNLITQVSWYSELLFLRTTASHQWNCWDQELCTRDNYSCCLELAGVKNFLKKIIINKRSTKVKSNRFTASRKIFSHQSYVRNFWSQLCKKDSYTRLSKFTWEYCLILQVMETYFELDRTTPSITALVKDPESDDIYIYAASATRTKALKIRRGPVGIYQQIKALVLVNDERNSDSVFSTDVVPLLGTLLRMATSGVAQVVNDGEESCFNVTVQSLGNMASGVSLVMSEGELFIGRENGITRMNNVVSMFSCNPTPTTRYSLQCQLSHTCREWMILQKKSIQTMHMSRLVTPLLWKMREAISDKNTWPKSTVARH